MKIVVNKARSVGLSSVSLCQPTLQVSHFLLDCRGLVSCFPDKNYFTVLVGEVSMVNYFGISPMEKYQPRDVPVFRQRLSDVVDLSSMIFFVGIRNKKYRACKELIGCDINDLPIDLLPDGVELCLDKYIGPFPDCPAYELGSAIGGNVLWNDGETFLQWLASERPTFHHTSYAFGCDAGAKLLDMSGANVGDDVHLVMPNVANNRPAEGRSG